MVRHALREQLALHYRAAVEQCSLLASTLPPDIASAAGIMAQSLTNGGKILVAAHGDAWAIASLFESQLMNGLSIERPALPCFLLSPINAEQSIGEAIARQFETLAQPEDLLVVIEPYQSVHNLNPLIQTAHQSGHPICRIGLASELSDALELRGQSVSLAIKAQTKGLYLESLLSVTLALCRID